MLGQTAQKCGECLYCSFYLSVPHLSGSELGLWPTCRAGSCRIAAGCLLSVGNSGLSFSKVVSHRASLQCLLPVKRQEVISTEEVCEEMRQWRVDHRGMAATMPEQRKNRLFPTFSPSFQGDVVHWGLFIFVFLL